METSLKNDPVKNKKPHVEICLRMAYGEPTVMGRLEEDQTERKESLIVTEYTLYVVCRTRLQSQCYLTEHGSSLGATSNPDVVNLSL